MYDIHTLSIFYNLTNNLKEIYNMIDNINYERKKVYDPILRICHWTIAISICLLIGTALINDTLEYGVGQYFAWEVHIFSGYIFTSALILRIIWGIIGQYYARWTNLFHLDTWKNTLCYFKKYRKMPEIEHHAYGHDPLASLIYLGVYMLFIMMALTGLTLTGIMHDSGPFANILMNSTIDEEFIEEIHEFGFNCIWAFIIVHIGALIFHEKIQKIPMAQSMISGYQYRIKKPIEKSEENNN